MKPRYSKDILDTLLEIRGEKAAAKYLWATCKMDRMKALQTALLMNVRRRARGGGFAG